VKSKTHIIGKLLSVALWAPVALRTSVAQARVAGLATPSPRRAPARLLSSRSLDATLRKHLPARARFIEPGRTTRTEVVARLGESPVVEGGRAFYEMGGFKYDLVVEYGENEVVRALEYRLLPDKLPLRVLKGALAAAKDAVLTELPPGEGLEADAGLEVRMSFPTQNVSLLVFQGPEASVREIKFVDK
jgi:hypothetical protein